MAIFPYNCLSLVFIQLLLAAAIYAPSVQAEIADLQEAVNVAGRQRMLTQRMLRDYALVGIGLDYQNPKQDLEQTIAEFDRQLTELKAYPVNDGVSEALASVDSQWRPIKERLERQPEKSQAVPLRNDLEELLKSAHAVVVLIADASGKKAGEIVNVSGRQRMLSQRMAALYMLRAWRVPDFDFTPEFRKVVKEFKASQTKLEQSQLTTAEIRAELDKANKTFLWFEMAAESNSDTFVPALILRSSDRILAHMDQATRMYAASRN